MNLGKEEFKINIHDRICQMVIAKVEQAIIYETNGLSETARGEGGFGSTGIK
jgi:dUTP pyrophosphatase